jgi:hypothetical protein
LEDIAPEFSVLLTSNDSMLQRAALRFMFELAVQRAEDYRIVHKKLVGSTATGEEYSNPSSGASSATSSVYGGRSRDPSIAENGLASFWAVEPALSNSSRSYLTSPENDRTLHRSVLLSQNTGNKSLTQLPPVNRLRMKSSGDDDLRKAEVRRSNTMPLERSSSAGRVGHAFVAMAASAQTVSHHAAMSSAVPAYRQATSPDSPTFHQYSSYFPTRLSISSSGHDDEFNDESDRSLHQETTMSYAFSTQTRQYTTSNSHAIPPPARYFSSRPASRKGTEYIPAEEVVSPNRDRFIKDMLGLEAFAPVQRVHSSSSSFEDGYEEDDEGEEDMPEDVHFTETIIDLDAMRHEPIKQEESNWASPRGILKSGGRPRANTVGVAPHPSLATAVPYAPRINARKDSGFLDQSVRAFRQRQNSMPQPYRGGIPIAEAPSTYRASLLADNLIVSSATMTLPTAVEDDVPSPASFEQRSRTIAAVPIPMAMQNDWWLSDNMLSMELREHYSDRESIAASEKGTKSSRKSRRTTAPSFLKRHSLFQSNSSKVEMPNEWATIPSDELEKIQRASNTKRRWSLSNVFLKLKVRLCMFM